MICSLTIWNKKKRREQKPQLRPFIVCAVVAQNKS
nr:MAG TPA: hypothetical protein [Caudoviricetes sp.]